MTRVAAARRAVLALLAVVTAALLSGCADRDMTAADARLFTRAALEEVGYDDVRVNRDVDAGVFRPSTGEPIGVWETTADVEGGTVHLSVNREGDRAVFLNDIGDDGGALLTDEQFAALERFRSNPASERYRDRMLVPTAAAAALVVLGAAAIGTAVLTGRAPARLPRRRWPRGWQ